MKLIVSWIEILSVECLRSTGSSSAANCFPQLLSYILGNHALVLDRGFFIHFTNSLENKYSVWDVVGGPCMIWWLWSQFSNIETRFRFQAQKYSSLRSNRIVSAVIIERSVPLEILLSQFSLLSLLLTVRSIFSFNLFVFFPRLIYVEVQCSSAVIISHCLANSVSRSFWDTGYLALTKHLVLE